MNATPVALFHAKVLGRDRVTKFAVSQLGRVWYARCLRGCCHVTVCSDISHAHLQLVMAEHAADHDRHRGSRGRG